MKDYFKYQNGFVNIDAEAIYLTNSGNWQEARNLKEKSSKTIRGNKYKKYKMELYFYSYFGLLTIATIYLIYQSKTIRIPVAGIVLGLFLRRYLANESGNSYLIPKNKIKSIILNGDAATINFLDENNNDTSEYIEKIDTKGIVLLNKLIPILN